MPLVVAPGVRRIPLPLPLALRIVTVYLVEGAHGWSLVDSGLHTAEAEAALDAALTDNGIARADVRHLFVTHLHPDHIGMAGVLLRTGTRVTMHRPELTNAIRDWSDDEGMANMAYAHFARHGMPRANDDAMKAAWLAMASGVAPFAGVATVEDRELVDLEGRACRALWTPGHTDYHAALFDEADGTLLAGDHVLPKITSNVGYYSHSRPDPLGDFLSSLRELAVLPVKRVLPAHGEPFDDLAGRVEQLLVHHAERLEACLAALESGSRTAWDVCLVLFPKLRSAHEERFAIAETLAHLRHLEATGRATSDESRPVVWRAGPGTVPPRRRGAS